MSCLPVRRDLITMHTASPLYIRSRSGNLTVTLYILSVLCSCHIRVHANDSAIQQEPCLHFHEQGTQGTNAMVGGLDVILRDCEPLEFVFPRVVISGSGQSVPRRCTIMIGCTLVHD